MTLSPQQLRTSPSVPAESDDSSACLPHRAPSTPASQIPPPPTFLRDTACAPPKNSTCPTSPPPTLRSPHRQTSKAQKNSRWSAPWGSPQSQTAATSLVSDIPKRAETAHSCTHRNIRNTSGKTRFRTGRNRPIRFEFLFCV